MGDKQDRLDKFDQKKKDRKSGIKKGPHGTGSDPDR
jgi:hypothetical protein